MKNPIIDKIKDANDIIEVVSEYITLKKRGVNYLGVCPFHGDSHPSMSVSPAKQMYNCFACGAKGDVIHFVEEYEHCSFGESLAILAKRAGIEYKRTEMTPEEVAKAKLLEGYHIAVTAATEFYMSHLQEASGYLAERGFSLDDEKALETLKLYKVGFAPSGNALKKYGAAKGYKHDYLIATDLLKRGDHGTFDTFRDRLMFPFMDHHLQVCGFTGRLLQQDAKMMKYLNTSDTMIYKKGELIFGLVQARNEIRRLGFVYLFEGQMDVLSMHLYGVGNAIAGSGCAFTEGQIRLLGRQTNVVTLGYDSDTAGLKASYENAMQLLRADFSIDCVSFQSGTDPDNFAQANRDKTSDKLGELKIDFVTYFCRHLLPKKATPEQKEAVLNQIIALIGQISSVTKRAEYCMILARLMKSDSEEIIRRATKIYKGLPELPSQTVMKDGLYGMDALSDFKDIEDMGCRISSNYDELAEAYGVKPVIYVKGLPNNTLLQQLRKECSSFYTDAEQIGLEPDGQDNQFTAALAAMTRAGITINIHNCVDDEDQDLKDLSKSELEEEAIDRLKKKDKMPSLSDTEPFVNVYVCRTGQFLASFKFTGDKTPLVERCAELISYSSDSSRQINMDLYKAWLGVSKGTLNNIVKPYVDRRKSSVAISAQTSDDLLPDEVDSDELPDYVKENPEFLRMWNECKFYPRVNTQGVPVAYIFLENNQKRQVADFFMEPLLHIYSDNDEDNKRVVKINRRFYQKAIYIELPSKCFTRKSTMEEKLIMLEAVNFSNGEEKHWAKIKEFMSRRYIFCSEIETYGNQQKTGVSFKEDEQFFAFSNGIYHCVNGHWQFNPINELGIVEHNKKNYYLPAFSTINSGQGHNNDKYEVISQLIYKDIPAEQQVTFDQWADLMDRVYKVNDNGKWGLLFAIMAAFRANIHDIDRTFTAPFFMGPMSSGKTEIALSIRALFISPKINIFNLTNGTDAAMATLMGAFRDVIVVLDEFNNNQISPQKFQMLKSIVYNGDGKQKRKGTSTKELTNEKVYSPVVICGQETPEQDDNSLTSRIIVCEVPKPLGPRSKEEVELFDRLKEIENPDRIGLSNVLIEILKLRPLVMKYFKGLKKECYNELKAAMSNVGEIDRLMNTSALFLATCKFIQDYTELKLPFTYAEFFNIALDKIKFQSELISRTDKLATFFKAMDVMIDTHAVLEGREFSIGTPERLTILLPGRETKEVTLTPGTEVLFLRVSNVFTLYSRSSFNRENSTQSTIDQNLRSHPSYIGSTNKRFTWEEVEEVPNGDFVTPNPKADSEIGITTSTDNRVTKRMVKKHGNTTCVALNYTLFKDLYNIDLQRSSMDETPEDNPNQKLPF